MSAAAALARLEGGSVGAGACGGTVNTGVGADITGTDILDTVVAKGLEVKVALLAVKEVVAGVEQGVLLDKAETCDWRKANCLSESAFCCCKRIYIWERSTFCVSDSGDTCEGPREISVGYSNEENSFCDVKKSHG